MPHSYMAKAKESLIYPEISGIFAGFKSGEYFLGRRLIICLFLSWKLVQKIILKFLDGNLNNSSMWKSVLVHIIFENPVC